ncbi:carbonic anhydrase [Rhabdaerophilum sp. SD176]|uniref:carbonic anhydrase n=1 Tax=Rhabdaerophilum sp. SD176 TaxID=2983548 RepID=UPI0024DFCE0B|nr:carbonic anhydrase [Rhabdaerophilum sp. SD176]
MSAPLPTTPFPQRLLDGYAAFKSGRLPQERERLFDMAENGQKPEIMIIACCDSRVSPEVIFDARPGEVFVVRNVANLVPPYSPDGELHGTSAALEFAVQALRVKHIVVMGHGRCGGVHAYVRRTRNPDSEDALSPGDFIGKWMTLISPAAESLPAQVEESDHDYAERLAVASIRNSVENLLTFPCVNILHGRGKLHLHGAMFDVKTGLLRTL